MPSSRLIAALRHACACAALCVGASTLAPALALAQEAPPRAPAQDPAAVRTCNFTTGFNVNTANLRLAGAYDCVSGCVSRWDALQSDFHCGAESTTNQCAIDRDAQEPVPADRCAAHACQLGGLVTRQGDVFRSAATPDEIHALLGAIDSTADALTWVRAAGYDPCAATDALQEDGTYEVFGTRTHIEAREKVETETRFRVAADGTLTLLEQRVRRTPQPELPTASAPR